MRRRGVYLLVLLFQAFWLTVVVPGHQRGIVQLPTEAGPRACPFCGPPAPSPSPKTPAQRRAACAICFFCAFTTTAPVFAFDPQPTRLLQRVRAEQREHQFARIVLVPFDACGPPAA